MCLLWRTPSRAPSPKLGKNGAKQPNRDIRLNIKEGQLFLEMVKHTKHVFLNDKT